MSRKPRTFYAIEYAYGRDVINRDGNRADHVHRFESQAERTRFLDAAERDGRAVDSIAATDGRVKKAIRAAAVGMEWPQAV